MMMNHKIKQFDKALARFEQNPSDYNKKQYWKRRDKLVVEFQHKYGFDYVKRVEKENEEMYAFDKNKTDVVCFSLTLIYNDLKFNVPKGKALDYLDYWLDNMNEPFLMQYMDWVDYNK